MRIIGALHISERGCVGVLDVRLASEPHRGRSYWLVYQSLQRFLGAQHLCFLFVQLPSVSFPADPTPAKLIRPRNCFRPDGQLSTSWSSCKFSSAGLTAQHALMSLYSSAKTVDQGLPTLLPSQLEFILWYALSHTFVMPVSNSLALIYIISATIIELSFPP